MADLPDTEALIRAPGPWVHRDVSAQGYRFHVVDAGEGPAVVLLHGFPTFWWTWRDVIPALVEQGYRVLAMDLRGYAGSDHPPEGYDPRTMASDVAGVIRSLGESNATIIGHGWGAVAAWSAAVLHPETVQAIAALSMPHPRTLRSALLRDRHQRKAMRYAWAYQVPFVPERRLTSQGAQRIGEVLHEWSHDPAWASDEVRSVYQAAFMRWPTAHTAIEYHRWAMRSALRPDGLSYMALMEAPVQQPVLQIHGHCDPMILPSSVTGSEEYVRGDYEFAEINAGHFVHEERRDEVVATIINWLARHNDRS